MDLFDRPKKTAPAQADPSTPPAPLAERMRPRTLGELIGQSERLGATSPLGRAIVADRAPSLVLWGPPGCGKTTIARVVAAHSGARFQSLSAVTSGVADVRNVTQLAEADRRAGRRTILFIDEIHRFNRAQQDALLPHVEAGIVTLIGATTENPSFALTAALLSRAQVVRLDPLADEDIVLVLERALTDRDRGLGSSGVAMDREALTAIARWADGDARRALTLLDHVVGEAKAHGVASVGIPDVEAAARERTLRYDRTGEEHYNVVSAFIKSMRGSDPDGALYWAMRMIEAGDDPLFVLRRMLIFAAEDVGMADPRAIEIVAAADHAFQRVGVPEGLIPIAHAVVYLAVAPKSKSAYLALGAVKEEIARSGALPVPMRLRNAVTSAMRDWGYGEGYRNPQAQAAGFVPEGYLPDALEGKRFYEPTQRGIEGRIADHLTKLRAQVAAEAQQSERDRAINAHAAAEQVARAVVEHERPAREGEAAPKPRGRRPKRTG